MVPHVLRDHRLRRVQHVHALRHVQFGVPRRVPPSHVFHSMLACCVLAATVGGGVTICPLPSSQLGVTGKISAAVANGRPDYRCAVVSACLCLCVSYIFVCG